MNAHYIGWKDINSAAYTDYLHSLRQAGYQVLFCRWEPDLLRGRAYKHYIKLAQHV